MDVFEAAHSVALLKVVEGAIYTASLAFINFGGCDFKKAVSRC